MQIKNTLAQIVNYEKTKIIWKVQNDVCQLNIYPLNISRSKKACDLKISQSIIYVKKYFYMFFPTLKDIIWAKSKNNHWIS